MPSPRKRPEAPGSGSADMTKRTVVEQGNPRRKRKAARQTERTKKRMACEAEATPRLTAVSDDVAQHLLAHLGAHDVTRLALTGSIWRNHVRTFRPKIVDVALESRPRPWSEECYKTAKITVEGRPHPIQTGSNAVYAIKDHTIVDLDHLDVPYDDFLVLARALRATLPW